MIRCLGRALPLVHNGTEGPYVRCWVFSSEHLASYAHPGSASAHRLLDDVQKLGEGGLLGPAGDENWNRNSGSDRGEGVWRAGPRYLDDMASELPSQSSSVCDAATMDWDSTWPPYTRPSGIDWETPVKMSSVVRAPLKESVRTARSEATGSASTTSLGVFVAPSVIGSPVACWYRRGRGSCSAW